MSSRLAFEVRELKAVPKSNFASYSMTHKPEDAAIEEIILPENLLPLGSVLGEGVTRLMSAWYWRKCFVCSMPKSHC